MRKLLFGIALTLPIAFVPPATALPGGYPLVQDSLVKGDLMVGVAGTVVIVRLVGAAAVKSAGAAVDARPVTGKRAGAETGRPALSLWGDYKARAALPLNRIGPVGRPMGEPPSGSNVISNS